MRRLVIAILLAQVCLMGCGPNSAITEALNDMIPPSPAEAARGAFNVYDADVRRDSIARLAAAPFGGEDVYLRVYRIMLGSGDGDPVYNAQPDPDATVRAAAVKALGMHGSVEDAALLIPRLRDSESFVRWEAAEALQKIHAPEAIDPLVRVTLDDTDADVRMSAATALGQYPRGNVFQTLIAALDDRDFAVAKAAERSLKLLTGQNFGIDPPAWLRWANQNPQDVFTAQRQYVWQPYQRKPRLLERAQFWRSRPTPEPRAPRGLEPDEEESSS